MDVDDIDTNILKKVLVGLLVAVLVILGGLFFSFIFKSLAVLEVQYSSRYR